MADYLELVKGIVNKDGRATPYFEDYLFQIIQALGGEGSDTITTAVVNAEESVRIPYIVGHINRLAKRISTLESDLSVYKVSHQVTQLQVDTAGYIAKSISQNYTAKHNDWVEASLGAEITLPSSSLKNHRVRVSNGDNTKKKVWAGSGEKIKIRGKLEDCAIINTVGNSYDFQWFGDYWRIA